MRKFMKKDREELAGLTADELASKFASVKLAMPKSLVIAGVLLVAAFSILIAVRSIDKLNIAGLENVDDRIMLMASPVAATSAKQNVITIPAGTVKANPFLPYRNIGDSNDIPVLVNDVPKFDLVEPPEGVEGQPEAARIMDTIVSGILYDKHSPTAILNIEGNDYLVKKGDVVNNYKVLAIAQDSVTVQLKGNTYKAGIGQLLSKDDLNQNEISNLKNKFGGEKR